MADEWTNWAGNVRCTPMRRAEPASESELAREVESAARAGMCVRAAGSGHSFTPLVESNGLLLSLGGLQGIESCRPESGEATVLAGSLLHDLGDALFERGLAFENLGDVDVQTVAGALSTGTHGTGQSLGNISSNVRALRLVTPSGETIEVDDEKTRERLRAARVSLGALGIITAARFRLKRAYCLHERIRRLAVDECLEKIEDDIAGHRHFEFFWYPGSDKVDAKTLSLCDSQPDPLDDRPYERIDWSARVLPSLREDRFFEMEYSVPAEEGVACFRAVRERLQTRHPDVRWPVEFRRVAADDAFLSPAYGRATATISLHQDGRLAYEELFADLEPIFAAAGGRPHWGKVHGLGARELRDRYPLWERFQAVREELDPKGVFMNAHLRKLFLD